MKVKVKKMSDKGRWSWSCHSSHAAAELKDSVNIYVPANESISFQCISKSAWSFHFKILPVATVPSMHG